MLDECMSIRTHQLYLQITGEDERVTLKKPPETCFEFSTEVFISPSQTFYRFLNTAFYFKHLNSLHSFRAMRIHCRPSVRDCCSSAQHFPGMPRG